MLVFGGGFIPQKVQLVPPIEMSWLLITPPNNAGWPYARQNMRCVVTTFYNPIATE